MTRYGSSTASSSMREVICLSLLRVFSISCVISSGSIADWGDLLQVTDDMTNVVASYFHLLLLSLAGGRWKVSVVC